MAEIAHEALIQEWERLKTWVAEDRSFRLWQEGLRGRMAEWEARDKHPGFLLTGPPLAEAEGRLAARPEDLSEDDSDYIRAGRRRVQRRKRAVRGTVAAIILILAAFGGTAWWQGQRANEAREEAERLVGFMTFDLRRKLEPLGKLELLQAAQQRVDAYYERLDVQEDNPAVMRRRAANFLNSGDLQVSLGDLAATEQLYAKGARILERLAAADPSNADWQLDLVVSLWKLSGAGLAEPEAAHGYLRQALEILEALNAAGKLHGEHRGWPNLVRRRLQALSTSGETD